MVAMTPLITIQILGLIYMLREKATVKAAAEAAVLAAAEAAALAAAEEAAMAEEKPDEDQEEFAMEDEFIMFEEEGSEND
jgi:ribosomal protein L12E/L44/L45/RPP1/RPP2